MTGESDDSSIGITFILFALLVLILGTALISPISIIVSIPFLSTGIGLYFRKYSE